MTGVRWWRVRRLRDELIAAPPSGAAQVVYITVFFLLDIFSWGLNTELFSLSHPASRSYWLSIGLALPTVKLLGPVVTYLCYRPAPASRFTDRFFALSTPIRVQVLLFMLLLLVPFWLVRIFIEGVLDLDRGSLLGGAGVGIFWLGFNLWHYTWLAFRMRSFRSATRHS